MLKAFNEIQYPFITKNSHKTRTRGKFLNLFRASIKITYNFMLNGECFSPMIRNKTRHPLISSIQHCKESDSQWGKLSAKGLEGNRDE